MVKYQQHSTLMDDQDLSQLPWLTNCNGPLRKKQQVNNSFYVFILPYFMNNLGIFRVFTTKALLYQSIVFFKMEKPCRFCCEIFGCSIYCFHDKHMTKMEEWSRTS